MSTDKLIQSSWNADDTRNRVGSQLLGGDFSGDELLCGGNFIGDTKALWQSTQPDAPHGRDYATDFAVGTPQIWEHVRVTLPTRYRPHHLGNTRSQGSLSREEFLRMFPSATPSYSVKVEG